jgi:two-component system sensor histidine kinase/response regulator
VLILGKKITGKRLIGHPQIFSLEERIFNTVCIVAFLAMIFEVPFNFFVGLYVPALLCVFGVFFAAGLYYLSRFKRKSAFGINLFCLICNLLFTINYFFNSGIFGPNLLLFCLAFLLVVTIIPKKHFKIWIPINISVVLIILTLEYFDPQLAPNSYKNEISKFIDFAMTYLVVVVLIYLAIRYIRDNYDYERSLVIEKNKAIEEQNNRILSQNLALERLNAEKDKLFSIVTHDIRTPLNTIQGYFEHLEESDISDEERATFKQQLLEITKETSSMLTNVLLWSKTQLEGTKVNLISLDVKNVLENALNLEKKLALKKGIQLDVSSEDTLFISADVNMFELVVRNLVNNAIKFTKTGGLITVNTATKDEDCLITIKDNGLGMDEALQNSLFKLTASPTYGTDSERGIGIGLLLCKEFTDLQDGKIWFESEKDKGSTFYLLFKTTN